MKTKPQLNAKDIFDSLRRERNQQQSSPEIVPSKGLAGLIDGFRRLTRMGHLRTDYNTHCPEAYNYDLVSEILIPESYTAHDVRTFCAALQKFQDTEIFEIKAGVYLSSAVNHAPEDSVELPLAHLRKDLHYMGYKLNKKMRIVGNVGMYLGCDMGPKGEILLKGNAGDMVGYGASHYGKITIEGTAKSISEPAPLRDVVCVKGGVLK